jgi:hypothetical protein
LLQVEERQKISSGLLLFKSARTESYMLPYAVEPLMGVSYSGQVVEVKLTS